MAKEKVDYLSMSNDQLTAELASAESDYLKARFDHTIKGLSNPMQLRHMRKEIARIKTEIRRREISAMTPEELAMRSKIRARRARKH